MNRSVPQAIHRWLGTVVAMLLVSAVWVGFYPALNAEFVQWDDDLNLTANPHIRSLNGESLRWMFTDVTYVRRYLPLAWLNWAVNIQLTGLSSRAFHLGNLLLHTANALLVWLLIARLLDLTLAPSAVHSRTALQVSAALGAAFWAVHPLRVESVAWASSRIYNQALLLLLLSWLSYLRAQGKAPATPGRRRFYWLSVACYAGSLLTYPIGIAGGLVPLLLDVFPLKRVAAVEGRWWNRRNALVIAEKLPYAGVLAAVLGMTVWARVHFAGTFDPPVNLEQFGWLARAMQAFYIWAYYLWKPFWPLDLAPVYTTLVWFKPTDPAFVASAAGVVAITVALVWNRRRWPALLAWWVGYLVMLGPVLGLTEHPHYPSDRYSYFATIPLSVLLAGALARCWQRRSWRSAMLGVLVAATGVALPLSARQTRTWHDSETLFKHVLGTLGENRYRGDIHWRLGLAYAQQARWAEAESQFRSALRYLPMFAEAHDGLAAACEAQGKPEEAAGHFAAAVEIRPTAIRHAALAANFSRRGRTAETIVHYRAALAIQPDAPVVLNNLAWELATARDSSQRNGPEAVQLAERACHLSAYQEPMMVGTLAAAYAAAGRFPDAMQTAQKAADLAAAKGQSEFQQKNLELLRLYRSGRSIPQAETDGVR